MASLVPPFTAETAHKKVKVAEDLWNTKYDDYPLLFEKVEGLTM
jgi:nuclear transport factor 2 (NTF2) superfamily protein